MTYTLTYSPDVTGWTSFYSFKPEFMVGMNQFFYSFKGGNLYRHNEGPRNTFYGVVTPSYITAVFNDGPVEKKGFKTITTESTESWAFSGFTDLESGSIDSLFFELKEGSYHAYIRSNGSIPATLPQFLIRTAQGIGSPIAVLTVSLGTVVLTYDVSINESLSIGDIIYSGSTASVGGVVTSVDRVENKVVIDTTQVPTPVVPEFGDFTMFVKNASAESNGLRGDYMIFTLTNGSVSPVELFAVKTEVFKSFP
jgi:hypothetical protein